MAKTDQQNLDYFKEVAARNDWTIEDFMSSRAENHAALERIGNEIDIIVYPCTISDAYLNAALNRINQLRTKILNEQARRSS